MVEDLLYLHRFFLQALLSLKELDPLVLVVLQVLHVFGVRRDELVFLLRSQLRELHVEVLSEVGAGLNSQVHGVPLRRSHLYFFVFEVIVKVLKVFVTLKAIFRGLDLLLWLLLGLELLLVLPLQLGLLLWLFWILLEIFVA